MLKDVACHAGKCWEVKKSRSSYFEDSFEEINIVDQIEKDLWKNNR